MNLGLHRHVTVLLYGAGSGAKTDRMQRRLSWKKATPFEVGLLRRPFWARKKCSSLSCCLCRARKRPRRQVWTVKIRDRSRTEMHTWRMAAKMLPRYLSFHSRIPIFAPSFIFHNVPHVHQPPLLHFSPLRLRNHIFISFAVCNPCTIKLFNSVHPVRTVHTRNGLPVLRNVACVRIANIGSVPVNTAATTCSGDVGGHGFVGLPR